MPGAPDAGGAASAAGAAAPPRPRSPATAAASARGPRPSPTRRRRAVRLSDPDREGNVGSEGLEGVWEQPGAAAFGERDGTDGVMSSPEV